MKTTIKKRMVRAGAGLLAALMFFTAIGSTALTAKAAEPDEAQVSDSYETMTEDELQAYFSDYIEKHNENPDDVDGNPAAAILAYLGSKVLDKFVDKALDSAWDSVFGKDPGTKEIMDKLNEIDGKLDQIMKLLNYLIEMMQRQDIKDSITQKNKYFNAIHAEAQTAETRFQSSKGKDNYKDLRWSALQKWYSLRLEGTSDAMSGLRFYCNMITDKNNSNWHGSYFSQYIAYAKLAWCWDTQRVPFEEAQRDREFFTVAQMATYNLMYLQYAEDRGVQGIDFKNERLEIAKMLKEVMDCYNKTPIEQLSPNIITCTVNGKTFQILYNNISRTDINENYVLNKLNCGVRCWEIEDNIRDELDSHKPGGSHVMTKAEMDMLLSAAQKENISFDTFMKNGAGKEITKGYTFLLSTNKNKAQVWHYGDRNWGRREAYLEHYISDGGNTDNHGKHVMTVSVTSDDKFEYIHHGLECDWSYFVYHEGDYWKEFKSILASSDWTRVMYVTTSDVMDYPETENTYTQEETDGIITELDTREGTGTFKLITTDGQQLKVEFNTKEEYTTLEGILEDETNVTVKYQAGNGDAPSSTIKATSIVVNTAQEEKY